MLPGKMVHTRKAQTEAYRSPAFICGSYASSTEQDVYAGGTDATQVRAALKTAAIFNWRVMGTDIRTTFLNAKRRDETKLVAMTIPAVFRKLNLARENDVWLWSKWHYMDLPRVRKIGAFVGTALCHRFLGSGSMRRVWR